MLPVLEHLKTSYLLWHKYRQDLVKVERFSLGLRIDILFVETIEALASATFLSPPEKLPYVRLAIRKIETIKILLLVLWETKSLADKRYIELSLKLETIGKMLGGWNGQLIKNSTNPAQTKLPHREDRGEIK